LLSFLYFIRFRARERSTDGIVSGVFLVLSLLAKINTAVAPAIFLAYDYKQGYTWTRRRAWSLACLFLIAAVFAGLTFSSFRATNTAASWIIDSTLIDQGPPHPALSGGTLGGAHIHFLNAPRVLLFYIRMAIFPYPLSAWHMFRAYGALNWITGAAWIALIGLLWILYRSPRSLQFWQLWTYLFLAPVLHIIPLPIWAADRYLYIPAVGVFVLWSKLFFHILERVAGLGARLALETAMAAVLLALAWQTHSRLPVWRNNLALWETTAKTCATSASCHGNLGVALLGNGSPELAARELALSIQIRPEPYYLAYLGDIYAIRFGDYRRALAAYRMAQQTGGTLPADFWAKAAKMDYMAGELDQASRAIEIGLKMNADEPGLWLVQGFLQWKQGNREQARRSLQLFLKLEPQSSNSARFINSRWGNAEEVGRLLADLGSL
jgi:tetratricopeptide (TPR) repeat protein